MNVGELHEARRFLQVLLTTIDGRLQTLGALSASDRPDDGQTLAERTDEARKAISGGQSGREDEQAVKVRADEVRRAMEAAR